MSEAGAWARENPSYATRIMTVRRGKRTTTEGLKPMWADSLPMLPTVYRLTHRTSLNVPGSMFPPLMTITTFPPAKRPGSLR